MPSLGRFDITFQIIKDRISFVMESVQLLTDELGALEILIYFIVPAFALEPHLFDLLFDFEAADDLCHRLDLRCEIFDFGF